MKRDKIVQLIGMLGVPGLVDGTTRTGWVVSRCPLGPWRHDQGESSPGVFGVRIENGDPRANCFACGWRGTLMALAIEMRHLNKAAPAVTVKWPAVLQLIEEADDEFALDLDSPTVEELFLGGGVFPDKPTHVFPDWWLESFPAADDSSQAMEYLAKRGVGPKMIEMFDMRWDSMQERICFPVHDFQGVLRGLHGRATEEGVMPRYRMYTQAGKNNPIVWLGERWVDLTKPIVMVEGPFDLVSVARVYRNVVTPLFNNPSVAKVKRMGGALEWVTFLDRGTGGSVGRQKISSTLSHDHVITHVLPPKHRKDPGEMLVKELIETLGEHVQLDEAID